MGKIKILTLEDTKKVLFMTEVIETVETVYREKTTGNAIVFPMIFHEFEPGNADMDIKSGTINVLNAFGLKLVSWFKNNPSQGLSALTGVVMIFDNRTGLPQGVINAEYMTGIRTGAAGAIGTKYLARKDAENMLMVGTGHQAMFQLWGALTVVPGLKRIRIYDPIDGVLADCFTEKMKIRFKEDYPAANIEAVSDLERAVKDSDIIVTATPSRKPLIQKQWVKPGTHFSCMGSDMCGKQEIDEKILEDACLIVDDRKQSVSVGEMELGIKKGIIKENDIRGEIGQVIMGKTYGRRSEREITVFDSTGIGLQDISVGALALKRADELGIGTLVDF